MYWKKISSAPKDGTWFLAHGNGPGIEKCPFVCNRAWDIEHRNRAYWEEVYSEVKVRPTHWMPLPDSPE